MDDRGNVNDIRAELATLVCKRGVGLGGLTHPQRELALAVAAHALPLGASASESEVNLALKQALLAEARFLDTDHVELRRWLVDIGWWQRDGFGRAYRRTAEDELRPALQAIDAALAGLDLPAWIGERLTEHRTQGEARRAAWAPRDSEEAND